MIYVIVYDLKEHDSRYDDLIARIKNIGNWARLGESCYLVETDDTAVQIRDNLKGVVNGNGKLYVGRVEAPAAWLGMPDSVSQWIKEKL